MSLAEAGVAESIEEDEELDPFSAICSRHSHRHFQNLTACWWGEGRVWGVGYQFLKPRKAEGSNRRSFYSSKMD